MDVNSVEEEEEEEDEDESVDDTESDEEPEQAISHIPTYTPGGGGPITIVTARKRVHLPVMAFASTSQASGSRTYRTARKSVIHPQSIFPTTSASPSPSPAPLPLSLQHVPETPPTASLPPASPTYAPMTNAEWDEYLAAEPSPTPLATPTYAPGEPYAPVSPQHTPATPPSAAFPPTVTAEDNAYMHGIPPITSGAPTSAPPPVHRDPAVATLIGQVDAHDLRIDHLEDTVELLAGPVQIDEMSDQVMELEDRVYFVEHRAHQLCERVLAPGCMADQFQTFQARLRALETERDFLRSRVRYLEQTMFSIHRATR